MKRIFKNPFIYPLIICLCLCGYTQVVLFGNQPINLSGRPLYDNHILVYVATFIFFIKVGVWAYFSEKKSNNLLLILSFVIDTIWLVGLVIISIEIINFHVYYKDYSPSLRGDEYSRIKTISAPFHFLFSLNIFLFLISVLILYIRLPKLKYHADVLDQH